MRAFLRRLAETGLVLGLVAASLLVATTASAHNLLLSTGPADGSTVATLPDSVLLTFNLPALNIGAAMEVIGPAGNVADGVPVLVDKTVRESVRPGSPAGDYRVLWRVTSADGHPISGQFTFTATKGNGGTAPATTSASASTASQATETADPTGSNVVLWLTIGGLAVVLVGGGILLSARRRRTAGGNAGETDS